VGGGGTPSPRPSPRRGEGVLSRAIGAVVIGAVAFALLAAPAAAKPGADYFPNVVLTTGDGKQVHFYDDLIKDKIVAINLIYTHCDFTCSLETARLAQVQDILQDRMGKDIFFYSITIDPDRDTPAVLKAYAEKFGAGPGWTFLTGKKQDIDRLAVKLGLTEKDSVTAAPDDEHDGHTPHLLVGNEATGQWLRDSSADNPRFLARLIGNFVDNGTHAPIVGPGGGNGAPVRMASPGRYLFAKECAACHTIGHGDKIGPDLKTVAKRRDHAWLAQYITKPNKMLAAGDPIATALHGKYRATMPNLGVGDRDLAALLAFLSEQADEDPGGSSEAAQDHADHHHVEHAAVDSAKAP
jgi:protein SCO1/2